MDRRVRAGSSPARGTKKLTDTIVLYYSLSIFIVMKKIDKESFIEICEKSESMAQASVQLNLHFNTFKKYAIKFGCYHPNQSGKGMTKNVTPKFDLEEILNGEHPHYQTYKLKKRMIKEGIIKNMCSVCNISTWLNSPLNLELDHIDGNRMNHKIDNLRLLCPNCHSQTENYRSKNKKK